MKLKLFLSVLAWLAFLLSSTAQETDPSKVIPEKRDKWIQETVIELVDFQPDTSIRVMPPNLLGIGETSKLSFRIFNKTLIRLKNGEWIYFVAHSTHDDEEIGDLCLAVNNEHRFYISESHVCGNVMHFESERILELTNTSDFFEYFVGDTDAKGWNKLSSPR